MDFLIKTENIDFIIKNNKILSNINFEIKPSDFITIIGPNGAGKSSLLKILLGIYKHSSGKITKNPNLRIGYIPQKLDIDYTIPLSVKYFLDIHKNRNIIDEGKTINYEEIIHKTNIENLLNKQITNISGGELQRVMIARSLIVKPNLLILDEPAQNLDISSQLEFYKLINTIYKDYNIAILMVSHDLHLVISSTQKVICLYKHICCEGEPHMVAKNDEFISIFGKDMSEMLAVYNHYHDHSHGSK